MSEVKAISSNVTRGINVGARLKCIDNTGAKEVEVIAVKGYKGIRRRIPKAGVGDVVIVTVKKGDVKIRNEVFPAVIVRQRMPYKRPNGITVKFEDNAVVLMTDKLEPKGKEVKEVVAREAVERFPTIGKIARIIV